jgi:hypothetical protein
MINSLNILLLIILFALLCYLISIICIQLSKGISEKEAIHILHTYIRNIFLSKTPELVIYYPVYIGIFNNQAVAELIEKEFDILNKIFESYYFSSYSLSSSNTICYSFRVTTPIKEMTEYELIQYCERECSSLVHRYMHKCLSTVNHVENLVFANIVDSVLYIQIATNSNGTEEIAFNKNKIHSVYISHSSNSSSFTESWDNHDLGV